MKNVTDNFKNDIRTYGRQFNFEVKINDVDVSEDDINYIKTSFNATLFKTIMHQIEIDSKNKLDLKSKINVKVGVKVNEPSYEYVSFNTYIVKSCERQEDTNSYVSLAYDKMIESMVDYDLEILEKIKLREYLIRVCQRLGWNTKNIPATFINSEQLVTPALHIGIGYTFRDVLDEIATISCSCLLFKNEEFYLMYPTETNENIDDSYLNEDDITIGEKYFINSLVFSRAEESDNIYRKDDSNIVVNGLHEYRVSDNQLLSTNDRDLYIDEMFNYLKTFEFYTFDVKSKGILFLEAYDRFNFSFNGNIYSSVLLNNEISFDDGLQEYLYLDTPEETETEYKYADTTDKKINQTYILVDKQNQTITSVVSNVSEQNQKISQVTQTVNELNSKISDIADITTSKESVNAILEFESINQSEPIYIHIHPVGTNIAYLYPSNNLYPSNDLFMPTRILRFTNTTTNEVWDYKLPDDLLIYDSDNYDEFLLDYDSRTVMINKRCAWNEDGSVKLLDNMITNSYDFPSIQLTDGDYKVELLGYSNAYMLVRLMAQNIYTTQFATKAELSSEISQTESEIDLSVNKKLSNYSTTSQMNSAINLKANEITSTVNDKFKNYSTTSQMNSTITQKANEITSSVSETYETKTNATTNYSKLTQTATSLQSQISSNDKDISTINQTVNEVNIEVGKKYNTSDFTNAKITAKLNDGTSSVQISADKIDLSATDILNLLAGNAINLTSKNITITSNAFKVDKNGKVTCSDIDIAGGKVTLKDGSRGNANLTITNSSNSNIKTEVLPDKVYLNTSDGGVYINNNSNSSSRAYLYSDGTGGGIMLGGNASNDISLRAGTSPKITCYGEVQAQSHTYLSLEEKKKNIVEFEKNAIEILRNSKLYEFNYRTENDNKKKHIGFVIGKNYNTPGEVISENGEGIEQYSMISLAWKAIQEQQDIIEQLQKEIKDIKKESEE